MALGLEARFERPERLREWTYEFDPAGFELLRRAIERVGGGTPGGGEGSSGDGAPDGAGGAGDGAG
jgi:hypothetical protein